MLKDIKSQRNALKILLGTIKKNRIPVALLMIGQQGIGKRLTAINYSKAINCYEPYDFDSCDKCISCRKIDSMIHPDVVVIEPQGGVIKIEVVRMLQEKLSLKPFEGKRKIAIIDEAHRMNEHASNAFLITLEEPPKDTTIILISSNEDSLPDTVRSRCCRIVFSPLSRQVCDELIRSKKDLEDVGLYLNLCMGMPGLALSRDFSQEKEWFFRLLKNMFSDSSKEIWENKEDLNRWINLLLVAIRDSIVFKETADSKALLLGEEIKCQSFDRALYSCEKLYEIIGQLDFNLNRNILWNYFTSLVRASISLV
ncbi:MAG: DNA polymerase III subunit delta' [Thermodesulfovibrionales bacterium]|nr:DNA polymerase III subunit delta' [Thermodesulfovibrionales bacterium]